MTSVDLSNVSNKKKPTEEQNDILREKGNRVVIAVPGSGKTYTLSLIIKEILCDSPNYKGVIAISYTNKASDELKDRSLSGGLDPKSSYFGTIDSFYYSEIIKAFLPRLWGRIQSEVQITDFKNTHLIESTDLETLKKIHNGIYQLNENTLAIIKKYYYKGFIFIELLGKLGLFTLEHSSSLQKYLKARYTHIIVDEYQDSGNEQHQLFISLVRFGLIGIAVGDVDQSIFRWAGKNPQYLIDLSKDKENFNSFILTLNHRCHSSIVNYSMRLLTPNIEIIDNKEKRVFHWKIIGSQEDVAKKIGELIPQIKQKYAVENNNQGSRLALFL